MAYSELIKSFEKIRDYMREFYVYGFKSREDYTKKSARSYDDERRRIESWLGGYMAFRHTSEGKNVFISVDNRSVTFNPLHNAWKAKSFTDKDIVLHFTILDLLADGVARNVSEITDGVVNYLSHTETPFGFDESTVRKKLKEYSGLGVLQDEKHGRLLYYRLAEDRVNISAWEDAAAFFSEEAPLGVVGSYLLDRQSEAPEHFSYKHHYLLHTLDTQILFDVILRGMGLTRVEAFTTIHNYIDTEKMILRKGSVSAEAGEKLLIPINMRDGSLICIGKGNEDWNCSAPHGAGRLMSRKQAFASLSMDEYTAEMEGVWSSCVVHDTLDESPMAYKPMDEIVAEITPTAGIIERIRPVYNFKAAE